MSAGRHDVALPGCMPEPLMAYLKALGVLRLVSEQKDPEARGWWDGEEFVLRSDLDPKSLVDFFLDTYRPTPVVAPWAGGSGFFSKDNRKAVDALVAGKCDRVAAYGRVIRMVRSIIKDERIGAKPKDDDKRRLIRRYRRELPDPVVTWMDAAMIVQQEGQAFAPLLGTGGNDGRLDFTQNFMQRVVALGLHERGAASEASRKWIRNSLLGSPAALASASVGQFAPGRAGGPNATQGMEGDSSDNPWDFILMIEGSLLLAGAAVRRYGTGGQGRSSFPFTVRPVASGFGSAAAKDGVESRGEIWLPLWHRPCNASELRQLFGEARSEIGGRPARNGVDFARAVASLGVDRGVRGFRRVGFLKRSGKAFLAAPLGYFSVTERRGIDLLREFDPWLGRLRRACSGKDAPARFSTLLRHLDASVLDYCGRGGTGPFQQILVSMGRVERALVRAERFREDKNLGPIRRLSTDWIDAAADGSIEFALARSLATVHDPEGKVGPLRANMEPVDWRNRCRTWAERDRSVVWNASDLARNLAAALERRMMEAARAGCNRLPVASNFAVPPACIAAFLDGALDDARIEDLLWGLIAVKPCDPPPSRRDATPLPRDYALLKLLFLPRPLAIDTRAGRIRRRFARRDEAGIAVRPEPRILPMLRAGRAGDACALAARRLRACGLTPMPGPGRDETWSDVPSGAWRAGRLAAALLFPVSSRTVGDLVDLVCRGDSAAEDALILSSKGDADR